MYAMRACIWLGACAAFVIGAVPALAAPAGKLNIDTFVAACAGDPNVTEEPGFEGGKVTPKSYCECVAGELGKAKLTQKDVDMLTKMHKEEISDADAEAYPTLEDLMNANEGYEDSCKNSLGLPADEGTDVEEAPMEEDTVPDDGQGDAPSGDDASPPE
jgi:hypothetical protein